MLYYNYNLKNVAAVLCSYPSRSSYIEYLFALVNLGAIVSHTGTSITTSDENIIVCRYTWLALTAHHPLFVLLGRRCQWFQMYAPEVASRGE